MALRLSALAFMFMIALACASAATTPSSDVSAPASPTSSDIGNTDPLADVDPALSSDDAVEGGLGSPLPAGILPPPDMSQSTAADGKDGAAAHSASSAVKLQAAAVAGFACISLSLLL